MFIQLLNYAEFICYSIEQQISRLAADCKQGAKYSAIAKN